MSTENTILNADKNGTPIEVGDIVTTDAHYADNAGGVVVAVHGQAVTYRKLSGKFEAWDAPELHVVAKGATLKAEAEQLEADKAKIVEMIDGLAEQRVAAIAPKTARTTAEIARDMDGSPIRAGDFIDTDSGLAGVVTYANDNAVAFRVVIDPDNLLKTEEQYETTTMPDQCRVVLLPGHVSHQTEHQQLASLLGLHPSAYTAEYPNPYEGKTPRAVTPTQHRTAIARIVDARQLIDRAVSLITECDDIRRDDLTDGWGWTDEMGKRWFTTLAEAAVKRLDGLLTMAQTAASGKDTVPPLLSDAMMNPPPVAEAVKPIIDAINNADAFWTIEAEETVDPVLVREAHVFARNLRDGLIDVYRNAMTEQANEKANAIGRDTPKNAA
jgi:uncharacterized protein YkvS